MAALCDGDNDSSGSYEIDNGPSLTPTPTPTQSAPSSIESLTDLMHTKLQPPAFTQLPDTMHTAAVNPKLPRKQVHISDNFGAPTA